MNIDETILSQLGGNKFLTTTGAKNLLALHNGLIFSLPRYALHKINSVTITLNKNDLYDIKFGNSRGLKFTEIKTINDIPFSQLQHVFTLNTGLSTHL
ncbi:hypothetical protein [Histophilus somni]|uniref:hypothetical protein n=1 Tax=Histophilus somni TaxID=731 RepID=UPI00201F500E|nr:hypothetical protein [Histophilus somni]